MNAFGLTPEQYDPPTYGGTPQQEAHAEMIQIFGFENPDSQWILSGYDVWEKNPYYHGPEQQHPEDDTPSELWSPYVAPVPAYAAESEQEPRDNEDDEIPF